MQAERMSEADYLARERAATTKHELVNGQMVAMCGELRFHAKDDHTLLTPTLIVEVLSPSTEAYDRGAKFHHYQSIPTLSEILLVASEERQVDHYRRVSSEPNRFELTSFASDSLVIPLPGLSASLSFMEIYEGTERFPL